MKSATFEKEIEKMLKNEKEFNRNGRMIMVCEHSPNWLIKLGYEDLPIYIGPGHIKSALSTKNRRNQHNISKSVLFKLPFYIQKPITVISSKNNRLEVYLKNTDNSGKILVLIMETNVKNKTYYRIKISKSHYINSIYGKDKAILLINKSIRDNGLLYPFNKSKNQIIKEIVTLQNKKQV